MMLENKVLWSEGMFLRPQHMQQQDRFYDQMNRNTIRLLNRNFWGVHHLEIDQQLLEMGTLAVKRCEGIFPDGTLFNIDSSRGDRLLFKASETLQNEKIYLTLPIVLSGADEAALDGSSTSLTRYQCQAIDVKDSNQGQSKVAQVNTATLRLQLLPESKITPDYTAFELCCIQEINGEGRIVLDEQHIPPLLNINVSATLSNLLKEVIGLLNHRSEAIAGRLTSERAGTSEVADFMLLQLANRYESEFRHLQLQKNVHPEEVFSKLVALFGEMSTFTKREKRATTWPEYDHNDLNGSFQILLGEVRQSLSMVFEQTAIELPLQERNFGVRVAPITDRSLLKDATFVIAVKSDWNNETVVQRMPTMIKAGGVEQLRDLVNLQLPGIALHSLTVPPKQVPYHNGFSYFKLEKSGENWAHLAKSGGIAFHFSGEIPGLVLELWAIKD